MKALEFKATEQMVHVVGEKSTREGTIINYREIRVLIDGRQNPVRDLRTGEGAAMRIREGPRGQDYTDLIRVRDRDRARAGGGTTAIVDGTVERVNG